METQVINLSLQNLALNTDKNIIKRMVKCYRSTQKPLIWISSNKALFCFGGFCTGGCTIKQKRKVKLHSFFSFFFLSFFYFLLKVWCLCGTTQQMNILSAEVGSLEAVNLNSRNVQTQFITCSPELTFSYFIWFHSGVFVGSTLQSLAIGLKQPWK